MMMIMIMMDDVGRWVGVGTGRGRARRRRREQDHIWGQAPKKFSSRCCCLAWWVNVSSPRPLYILNLRVWRNLPTATEESRKLASSSDLYANIQAWYHTKPEDNLEDIAFGSHVLLGAILLRLSCLQRKRRGRKYNNNIICYKFLLLDVCVYCVCMKK